MYLQALLPLTIRKECISFCSAQPYFGITSLIIGIILMILPFNSIIDNLANTASNAANGASSTLGGILGGSVGNSANGEISEIKTGSLVSISIACILSFVIYWLAGFIARKATTREHLNILEYSNQLATFTNSALICELATFVLTLLNGYTLALFLLGLTFTIYTVGLIYVITRKSNHPFKIYAAIIAAFCDPVIIMMIFRIIVSSAMSN